MKSKSSKKPKAVKKAANKASKKVAKKATKKSVKGRSYKANAVMDFSGGEHKIIVSKETKRDAVLYVRVKPENLLALNEAAAKAGVTLAAYVDQVCDQLKANKII